jgi:excinuclease ABC subunit C
LVDLLKLPRYPRRIEGYDISHMQGTDVVASMVVFTNGVSDKGQYRKFKTKINHNNDFYNMNETLKRRLSDKNVKAWGKPDLMLIDGGKGQLDAALQARDELGHTMPFIGLAKREEQIVVSLDRSNVEIDMDVVQKLGGFISVTESFTLINLPHSTHVVKLLQRIRDESHRFAVSYHSVLKIKRQTASLLDDIPTIGPETRKKLLRTFGSVRGVIQARDIELQKLVGEKKAVIIRQYLRPHRKREPPEVL